MYAANEGFGGPPGSLEVSQRWRRISYVLIPVGVAMSIGAGIGLMIVDRKPAD